MPMHAAFPYAHAMKRLLQVAPEGATVSWLNCTPHLRRLVRFYRQEGLSAATERRELPAVSVLIREHFGEARRRELFQELSLRRPDRGRDRWLDREEVERVREVSGDWWTIIGTAMATGARRGELLALRVRDLDFAQGSLVVQHEKSARARRFIPLAGEMATILQDWVEAEELGSDDLEFGQVAKTRLRQAWDRIREEAGIPEVRFHDLGHTYAVHCSKNGMPLVELQQRLGHATITMTQRDAVYAPPIASVHYQAALDGMGMAGDTAAD